MKTAEAALSVIVAVALCTGCAAPARPAQDWNEGARPADLAKARAQFSGTGTYVRATILGVEAKTDAPRLRGLGADDLRRLADRFHAHLVQQLGVFAKLDTENQIFVGETFREVPGSPWAGYRVDVLVRAGGTARISLKVQELDPREKPPDGESVREKVSIDEICSVSFDGCSWQSGPIVIEAPGKVRRIVRRTLGADEVVEEPRVFLLVIEVERV